MNFQRERIENWLFKFCSKYDRGHQIFPRKAFSRINPTRNLRTNVNKVVRKKIENFDH